MERKAARLAVILSETGAPDIAGWETLD